MQIRPSPPRLELDELVRRAKEWWEKATPEQREAMMDAQRKSYVRSITDWPRDCPYR